jgi:hypothetical protein
MTSLTTWNDGTAFSSSYFIETVETALARLPNTREAVAANRPADRWGMIDNDLHPTMPDYGGPSPIPP